MAALFSLRWDNASLYTMSSNLHNQPSARVPFSTSRYLWPSSSDMRLLCSLVVRFDAANAENSMRGILKTMLPYRWISRFVLSRLDERLAISHKVVTYYTDCIISPNTIDIHFSRPTMAAPEDEVAAAIRSIYFTDNRNWTFLKFESKNSKQNNPPSILRRENSSLSTFFWKYIIIGKITYITGC